MQRTRGQRHFDELAEDSRLSDPEDSFTVNVFYKMLDIASNQSDYSAFCSHANRYWEVLGAEPGKFLSTGWAWNTWSNYTTPTRPTGILRRPTGSVSNAGMQLVSVKASLRTDNEKASSIKQLAHRPLLIVEYGVVSSVFAAVLTSLLLFLTLPVTAASAEVSFYQIENHKIISSKNKMGQIKSTEWWSVCLYRPSKQNVQSQWTPECWQASLRKWKQEHRNYVRRDYRPTEMIHYKPINDVMQFYKT